MWVSSRYDTRTYCKMFSSVFFCCPHVAWYIIVLMNIWEAWRICLSPCHTSSIHTHSRGWLVQRGKMILSPWHSKWFRVFVTHNSISKPKHQRYCWCTLEVNIFWLRWWHTETTAFEMTRWPCQCDLNVPLLWKYMLSPPSCALYSISFAVTLSWNYISRNDLFLQLKTCDKIQMFPSLSPKPLEYLWQQFM